MTRTWGRRIHSRDRAEEAFDLPVVAEIPRASWHAVDGSPEVEISSRPYSESSQAYFRLAAQIDRALRRRRDPNEAGRPPGTGSALLITSAGDEPTRSFVAVNLAAVFADAGDCVIVATTRGLGGPPPNPEGNGSGPRRDSDPLAPSTPSAIVAHSRPSWIPGVSSLALGDLFHTGAAPTDFGAFTDAARDVVNYLVIEAPVGSTEAKAALTSVDLVVVVCESGLTSADDASECEAVLSASEDAGQKVLGLVLANP